MMDDRLYHEAACFVVDRVYHRSIMALSCDKQDLQHCMQLDDKIDHPSWLSSSLAKGYDPLYSPSPLASFVTCWILTVTPLVMMSFSANRREAFISSFA
jgi:hypothetical protein